MPNVDSAAALVRACFELPCPLRGNAPPRRSADACAAGANTTDLLPDVVVSAGEALRSGTAVGRWSLPAGPGIVLLMPQMSPLLWLRISPPLLLLLLGRLLLMVMLLMLLPREHLLRATLLLVATSTIVVALG